VSTTVLVVLIVMGVLAILVVVWVPIIIWLRRRNQRVTEQLQREIEGEVVIRPPEKGSYRGATAPGYPVAKGNCMIALTRRRLVVRMLVGNGFEVPVETITGVRDATVFKGAVTGGYKHLIVQTAAGEIAFFVWEGIADWAAALTSLTPGQPTSS
jgi:hypothetical protein